jgi:hypothetical protein
VDFELGDGFIIEEELRVQNADLDTENVVTGKRTRRKPTRFEAKPASTQQALRTPTVGTRGT